MPGYRGRSRFMGGRGRGKRSYKKKVMRNIEYPNATCKSTEVLATPTPVALATKTLASQLITAISQGDDRDDRERGVVHLKGINIRFTFRNTDDVPKFCNIGLVNPKSPYPSTGSNLPFSNTNFFAVRGRDQRLNVDMGASGLTGLDYGTLPISTDTHNVIWHMRFRLGVRPQSAADPFTSGVGAANYRQLSRYIKIPRKLSWTDSSSTSCNAPIFLVWWVSNWEEGVGSPIATSMVYTCRVLTYFRDAK